MRVFTGDNTPLDFCDEHVPSEADALFAHGEGEGPDGRGNCFSYDTEHPPYDDGMDIRCFICGRVLTADTPYADEDPDYYALATT